MVDSRKVPLYGVRIGGSRSLRSSRPWHGDGKHDVILVAGWSENKREPLVTKQLGSPMTYCLSGQLQLQDPQPRAATRSTYIKHFSVLLPPNHTNTLLQYLQLITQSSLITPKFNPQNPITPHPHNLHTQWLPEPQSDPQERSRHRSEHQSAVRVRLDSSPPPPPHRHRHSKQSRMVAADSLEASRAVHWSSQ